MLNHPGTPDHVDVELLAFEELFGGDDEGIDAEMLNIATSMPPEEYRWEAANTKVFRTVVHNLVWDSRAS